MNTSYALAVGEREDGETRTASLAKHEAMSELVIWFPDERMSRNRLDHLHGSVPSAMILMLSEMYVEMGWAVSLSCPCKEKEWPRVTSRS